MRTLSLRGRLTVWYTLALLAALSIFAALVLWQQGRIGLRRVDRELTNLTATLSNMVSEEIDENAPSPATEAIRTMAARTRAVAVLDDAGRPVAASWNGLTLPAPLPAAAEGDREWTAVTAGGTWRVHVHPERLGNTSYVLVVGAPLAEVLRERHEVQEAMLVGIPVAVFLAALGGLWLASVGLRPIAEMASRAARIPLTGMEDLGESHRDDELGRLARAFNGLVARLRAALQTQRQFMADASHELRTPVSVMRSAADVTLARDHRDEPEYREALSIVDEQARRVTRLVDDMLVLARADTGGYPLQRVHLYVDELVADCRRTLQMLATERGVAIQASPPAEFSVFGDEDLLRRLLLNVVQNAVQHTPSGGSVRIDVVPKGPLVTIDVTNDGTTIADADRERIFDRFVQLDPARRTSGAGLGLPIARWIATVHGGTLVLNDSGPLKTTFSISLPLSS